MQHKAVITAHHGMSNIDVALYLVRALMALPQPPTPLH